MLLSAEERNISETVSPGCGWSKTTLLEDEDDRMRYQHNERHLGADPKHDVLTRTVILGSPHTGVELLSHLLAAYPASLLISDPVSSVIAPSQDEARTARRLSWMLRRIFQCDIPVLLSLASSGALTQYGDQADRGTTARRMLSPSSVMIDNIMVTSLTTRLNSFIWWLSQDPQVTLIHLVRHPRSLLAEKLARDHLSSIADIKLLVADICGDFREDLSASNNLNSARYLRVKYEDLLETPANTTISLLERIDLPRHPNIFSLLSQVETIQLDQVTQWTGDITQDLRSQLVKESAGDSQLWVPNINLDADFISQFVTNEIEDILKEECEDVMLTMGYNFI